MAAFDVENPAWLSEVLGRRVVACKLDDQDLDKINIATCIRWITVEFEGGEGTGLVLKTSKPGDEKAQLYGLAREGLFYAHWPELEISDASLACQLRSVLPRVFRSVGDMATASKSILIEDLASCVQSGYFFGAGNPNNWNKDLDVEKKGFELTPAEVTALAFSAAAKLHAAYWNCEPLRRSESLPWLRAAGWLAGGDRESWLASQNKVAAMWAKVKERIEDGSSEVTFNPLLVDCMDASIAKVDWDAFQAELGMRPCGFTLTHGDFHPANFLVRPKNVEGQHSLVLIDWEVVGLGSGPQELGQYMISHPEPALRARLERGAVEAYYSELTALNPSIAMSLDECWAEYVTGGLGRWLWFVPLLVETCPPAMGQFFADQVHSFIADHGVTPASVPMPRA